MFEYLGLIQQMRFQRGFVCQKANWKLQKLFSLKQMTGGLASESAPLKVYLRLG